MHYTATHRAVFKRYLADPHVLHRLDDDELDALLEDVNFTSEVNHERERRSQLVAPTPPLPPRPGPVAKTAASGDEGGDDWDDLIKKYGTQPARKSLVFRFAGTLAAAVRELRHAVRDMGASNAERVNALERRIEALEQQQQQKAAGTWHDIFDETRSYPETALVTHGGGLWIATRSTTGNRPGDSSGAFVLVVKRGSYDRGER